jgi:hypothetical protein
MNSSEITYDRTDVLLGVASLLILVFSAGATLLLLMLSLMASLMTSSNDVVAPLSAAFAFALMGLSVLPLLYSSSRAVFGYSRLKASKPPWILNLLILLLPLGILIGTIAYSQNLFPAFLGSVGHILAAIGPVFAASVMVLRAGDKLSFRRRWASLNAGLWVSPFIALILELFTVAPLAIAFLFSTTYRVNLEPMIVDLMRGRPIQPDVLTDLTANLIEDPVILLTIFAYVGVFVPLVEELVKTIAVWPLLRRGLKMSEAFTCGALAGAGYALFEAFFLAQPGDEWALVMVARAGATLMHMFTTGVAAVGVARAYQMKSFSAALPYYFGAVSLHALWNFAALTLGVGFFYGGDTISGGNFSFQGFISLASLSLLFLLAALAYFGLSRMPTRFSGTGEPSPEPVEVTQNTS